MAMGQWDRSWTPSLAFTIPLPGATLHNIPSRLLPAQESCRFQGRPAPGLPSGEGLSCYLWRGALASGCLQLFPIPVFRFLPRVKAALCKVSQHPLHAFKPPPC